VLLKKKTEFYQNFVVDKLIFSACTEILRHYL